MAGFELLEPSLQHHIVNELGWQSLRPLQEQALQPVLAGNDALLLAPTAGGKTEAAVFPLLTRMTRMHWQGTSVLYLTPLRALLNNLHSRLQRYAGWLGRSAAVRHGDTSSADRKKLLAQPPDILLTTPESLEAMLLSTKVDPKHFFAGVQAVVVDEIHAFAGDDRGWHLQGVLKRLSDLVGRPLQRIGLSATVGNAEWLLGWLQGANLHADLPGVLISPPTAALLPPDIQLDYVGSVTNAATVIAALHRGEKRLVFCESRRQVERLAEVLIGLGIETYVSHSSVSVDDRRRAEAAFAEGRDCVIVATSTLELGVDVGDLDRVIQLGSSRTVASMLQRLGRTGRRPQTRRNLLILGIKEDDFLRAAACCLLWGEDYVEPLVPPPEPLHIVAQQALALVAQSRAIGEAELVACLQELSWVDELLVGRIVRHLQETGHLDRDGDMLFVGPEADRRYGRMYYRDLMTVFLASPEFLILYGREEIGSLDPLALLRKVEGPRYITLGGRPWHVVHIDWGRHRAYVEPSEQGGVVEWFNTPAVDGPQLADAMRRVLLGFNPQGIRTTRRADHMLAQIREERRGQVDAVGTRVVDDASGARWWTWAGAKRNLVLASALDRVNPGILDGFSYGNTWIKVRPRTTLTNINEALVLARLEFGENLEELVPDISDEALVGLKFSELLPDALARWALGRRAIG